MHVVSIISVIILIAMVGAWFFCAVYDIKISKGQLAFFACTILGAIVLFAAFYKTDSGDLSRHYQLLDDMRKGGWAFAKSESSYSSLFVYNTFAYLVAKSGQYFLLQTIPLIIDFCVFLYIYFDVLKHNEKDLNRISSKQFLFVFFLWICTFGLKLAVMGIRCVLAVALCALAIYLEYIRGRRKIFAILLYITALFIHNFALLVLLVRLCMYSKNKIFLTLIFALIFVFGGTVFRLLYNASENFYFQFIFLRLTETFGAFQFSSVHLQNVGTAFFIMWGGFVLITVYLLYMSIYTKKRYSQYVLQGEGLTRCENKLFSCCYTIGLMGLPMAFNYLYIERYMYLVAWALLFISYYYLKTVKASTKRKELNFWIMTGMSLVLLFVFFFNDIYLFMVNYVGYYFLGI